MKEGGSETEHKEEAMSLKIAKQMVAHSSGTGAIQCSEQITDSTGASGHKGTGDEASTVAQTTIRR